MLGSRGRRRSGRQYPAAQTGGGGGGGQGPVDDAAAGPVHRQRRDDRGSRPLRREGGRPAADDGGSLPGLVGTCSPSPSGRGAYACTTVGVKGWEVVFRGDRMQADLLAAVLEAN